jgi:hypothetical protein
MLHFLLRKLWSLLRWEKNYNENGRRAEFQGSNTHSSGDISFPIFFRSTDCKLLYGPLIPRILFFLIAPFQLGLRPPRFWGSSLTHNYQPKLTHTHTLGFLWMSDQLVAEDGTQTTDYIYKRPKFLLLAKFEPATLAIERPQICVLDCTATGIGHILCIGLQNW